MLNNRGTEESREIEIKRRSGNRRNRKEAKRKEIRWERQCNRDEEENGREESYRCKWESWKREG